MCWKDTVAKQRSPVGCQLFQWQCFYIFFSKSLGTCCFLTPIISPLLLGALLNWSNRKLQGKKTISHQLLLDSSSSWYPSIYCTSLHIISGFYVTLLKGVVRGGSPLALILHISGQNIIFHQPWFPWNKGISLTKPSFGVRSCEVAIIWPDISYTQ